MLEALDRVIDEIGHLNSKLLLIVGPARSGKSHLLGESAARKSAPVLSLGTSLGRNLIAVPRARRHLIASEYLGALAREHTAGGILFVDNTELLFDHSLQLNPLDLLKRHAQGRRVITVWPGDFNGGRLTYATTGHPEYRDYSIDGVVPFDIQY